jgi:hypothetical protein
MKVVKGLKESVKMSQIASNAGFRLLRKENDTAEMLGLVICLSVFFFIAALVV